MMKLIIKLDDMNETLESQEKMLRLKREKSESLKKNHTNKRKENKRLQNSLKIRMVYVLR
jgi:hypothetical protein